MNHGSPNSPNSSDDQRNVAVRRAEYFDHSKASTAEKLLSWARFVKRQDIARLVAMERLVSMTSESPGCIAECSVYWGQGLMTYAHLCASLEPYNYQCRILGFDTFSGDTSFSEVDANNPMFD